MLHAVAELGENVVRHVERILGDEVDADSLGADQLHHLLDLVHKPLRRILEQQVRLVEEEHKLRLVGIARFRQLLEQFGQQPQQEGGIELRRPHQPVGGQNVDVAAPVAGGAHEVAYVEGRLPEELLRPLLLEHHEPALDGAYGAPVDVAVFGGQPLATLRQILQQRPQILQVEQQKPFLVGDAEGDVQRPLLRLGQTHETGERQRPHLGDGRPDGMPLLA